MKRILTTLVTAAAVAVASASAAWAAEVTWRLGSSVGPKDITTLRLVEMAERIKEKSGGRFEIEVVPLETIGFKNVDTLRVLKQGVLDAMYIVPYYVSRDEPLLAALMPHGGLVDADENLKIVDTQYEISNQILRDKWNIVPASRGPFGALRDLVVVTKKPINTLEGLKGIKFRHFTKSGLKAFNNLGISTQVVPSSELYLALKTGVVDGSVYGPTYIKSQSIYEVTCCYAYLGAFTMANPFTIGVTPAAWERTPADLRKIMQDVANEMWAEGRDKWKVGAAEKDAYTWLKEKGMKELDPMPLEDRKKIQTAVLEVWKSECERLGPDAVANYNKIVAALKK